jgi:hypothetical protein
MMYPALLLGPMTAPVVTNRRVFEISLQRLTARPKMTVAKHIRESVTAEWTRDALAVGIPNPYGEGIGEGWAGKLSIISPSGTHDLWAPGERRKDRAQAIAAALNTDRS